MSSNSHGNLGPLGQLGVPNVESYYTRLVTPDLGKWLVKLTNLSNSTDPPHPPPVIFGEE